MITNTSLWTPEVDKEFARLTDLRALYDGEHERVFITDMGRKLRFRYVPENLLRAMSERLSDLQFPRMPRIHSATGDEIGTSDQAREEIERISHLVGLETILYPTAIRASYAGYADWRIVTDSITGDPYLLLWGSRTGEFTTWEVDLGLSKQPRAVNYWFQIKIKRKDDDPTNMVAKTYLIRERLWIGTLLDSGNAGNLPSAKSKIPGLHLQRTAYDLSDRLGISGIPKEVDWDIVAPAWPNGSPPLHTFTPGLTMLPGFRIPNTDTDGDGNGDSDYTADRTQFQDAVNIIVSSRQFAVRMLEDPVIMQKSEYLDAATGMRTLDANGSLVQTAQLFMDADQVRNFVQQPGDDGTTPIDITNWQSNLPGSEFQWSKLEEAWYKITPLCRELDGYTDQSSTSSSGYARRLSLMKVEIAVKRRRHAYRAAFQWLFQFTQALERASGQSITTPITTIAITWPPVVPEDPNEMSNRLTMAHADGEISDFEYITMLHDDWSPQQVEQEIARIADDVKRHAEMGITVPPVPKEDLPSLLQDGQARAYKQKKGAGGLNEPPQGPGPSRLIPATAPSSLIPTEQHDVQH
jgi:hypothetical protein